MKQTYVKFLSFVVLVLGLSVATLGYAKEKTELNVNEQNVFLDGYDVVAYFKTYAPTLGSPQHAALYKGAKFYFSSENNLNDFMETPEKFMPKYNGFCAYGVASGNNTVKVNPHTFKIYNGELLLFFDDLYKGERLNTIVPWNEDEQGLYSKAEAHWAKTH